MTMRTYENVRNGYKGVTATEMIQGRPSATYGRGRVCVAAGCRARLSLYNPGERCSLHDHPLY